MKMLILHYHELMQEIEEHERKNYLIVDDYIPDKVINKIKEIIGIRKFDDTTIFLDTDDRLPHDINFKNVVISMTCVVKHDGKFYLQALLVA